MPDQTRVRITLPWPRQRTVSRAKSSNVGEARLYQIRLRLG